MQISNVYVLYRYTDIFTVHLISHNFIVIYVILHCIIDIYIHNSHNVHEYTLTVVAFNVHLFASNEYSHTIR